MQIMQQSPRLPFAGQAPRQVRPNAPALTQRPDAPEADRLTFSQPKFAGSPKFGGWFNYFMTSADVEGELLRGRPVDEIDEESGDTALTMAADCNNHEIVKTLLDKKANIDHQNHRGDTALINAASNGRLEMAKTLVAAGANLDRQNKDGRSALMETAQNGHYYLTKHLLDAGANPNLRDKAKKTAENLAKEAGQHAVASMLYYTSDEAKKGIETACREGNTDQINEALEHGMPADVMLNGQTPLMIAAEHGHMTLLNTLLMENIDPRRVGRDDNTAVIYAAKSGHHNPLLSLLTQVDTNHINHKDQWGNTALNWAARHGHYDIASTLLKRKADVNIPNHQGNTPLAMAARNGDEEMATLLLKYQPKLDHPNTKGNTPIMQAAKNGKTAMVSLLREHGAREDIRNEDGKTVDRLLAEGLAKAERHAEEPQEEPARAANEPQQQRTGWGGWLIKGGIALLLATAGKPLLQRGYDAATGKTSPMKANSGNVDFSQKLKANSINVDFPQKPVHKEQKQHLNQEQAQTIKDIEATLAKQVEALVQKSGAGDQKEVHKLIAQGLDINQPNAAGITPLGQAAINNRPEMIAFLAEQGADVDKPFGQNYSTALMHAARHGNSQAIEALAKAGANVNQANKNGWTALMHAARHGIPQAIEALAKAGANVNQVDKDGQTALMITAQHGYISATKMLAKAGANINQLNKNGSTALMYASQKGHTEIVRVLAQNPRTDVNRANKDGWTALMSAAFNGRTESITALIQAKANINQVDKDSWTALIAAARNGHWGAVKVLVDNGADMNVKTIDGKTALDIALENKKQSIADLLKEAQKKKSWW